MEKEIITWEEIKDDPKKLGEELKRHIREAKNTRSNAKTTYDRMKLDLRHFIEQKDDMHLTEKGFISHIASMQSEELWRLVEYIRDQYNFAFEQSNQANNTLSKEIAENKLKIYSKGDLGDMPDIIVVKQNAEDHARMVDTLEKIAEYRYDMDRQNKIIEDNLRKKQSLKDKGARKV